MKKILIPIFLLTSILALAGIVFVLHKRQQDYARPLKPVWGDPVQITKGIEVNSVQFLPDGTLLFAGNGGVLTADADGSNMRTLFYYEGVRRANMSPDGRKIVLDNDLDIFVANPDGSNLVAVADDPDLFEFAISFTPDGEAITFVVIDDVNGVYKIRAMDPDGGNKRDILTSSDIIFRHPRQSPDGNRISYFSVGKGKKPIIWLMDKDEKSNTALTDPRIDGASRQASWSSNGKQFVFASNKEGDFDIWTMDSKGGNKTKITSIPGDEAKPVWSPDHQTIAFVCSDCFGGIGSDIYIISRE